MLLDGEFERPPPEGFPVVLGHPAAFLSPYGIVLLDGEKLRKRFQFFRLKNPNEHCLYDDGGSEQKYRYREEPTDINLQTLRTWCYLYTGDWSVDFTPQNLRLGLNWKNI